MEHITKDDSYIHRRQFFRKIWNELGRIDDKPNVTNNKVIKTLRIEPKNRCLIAVKKERNKTLKKNCNKLLTFCNLQDNNDLTAKKQSKKVRTRHRSKRKLKKLEVTLFDRSQLKSSQNIENVTESALVVKNDLTSICLNSLKTASQHCDNRQNDMNETRNTSLIQDFTDMYQNKEALDLVHHQDSNLIICNLKKKRYERKKLSKARIVERKISIQDTENKSEKNRQVLVPVRKYSLKKRRVPVHKVNLDIDIW